MLGSSPQPTSGYSAPSSSFNGKMRASALSSTCRNSRPGVPVPAPREHAAAAFREVVGRARERRPDVARLEVEIVAGTVEVGRHRRDEAVTVPRPAASAQLDAGDLGDGVSDGVWGRRRAGRGER
jgi:hypothetical protein